MMTTTTTGTSSLEGWEPQLLFLRHELQRLQFEEEAKRKTYNESRIALQEVWDKLVNIRSHMHDIRAEVEAVQIEAIANSTETGNWRRELEGLEDGLTNLSLASASRTAEMTHLKDKIRLKEALHSKVLMLEEAISAHKQKIMWLSQVLKENAQDLGFQYHDNSFSMATSRSMDIRSQLLAVSKELNDMEVQLSHFRSEHNRIEHELSQFLQLVNRKDSRSVRPANGARLTEGLELAKRSNYDEVMVELVSHGRPFSSDLVEELLKNHYALDSAEEAKDNSSPSKRRSVDYSMDDLLGANSQVIRMNGELPSQYIQRLERRYSMLEHFEIETASEFRKALIAVKRFRDLVSFLF